MPKRFKIFLDSSALISGLNSPTGAAGIILSAFQVGDFFIYISNQVLEEVQRNIQSKFPLQRKAEKAPEFIRGDESEGSLKT